MVDLAGHSPSQPGYTSDSLQCIYSSGKNVEAIAMAMFVSRGVVKYSDLVAKIWPEFGTNGKEGIMVADVMRHGGGSVSPSRWTNSPFTTIPKTSSSLQYI